MPSEIPAGVGTDDSNPDEVVYRCPGSVKAAAWIIMVVAVFTFVVVLVLGSDNFRGYIEVSRHSYHFGKWVSIPVVTIMIGFVVMLGYRMLKGKVWAYYLIGLLTISSIVSDLLTEFTNLPEFRLSVLPRIQLVSMPVSAFDILILLLLAIGFGEYREFCQSRRISRSAV